MLVSLGAGLLTASLCAYIGNFVLMKEMTFIAVALAEVAALGVALGFAWGLYPELAGFAATMLAVLFFWARGRSLLRAGEGTIGLLYAAAAAVAVILVSANPRLEAHGIDLMSGNLLYCTTRDVGMLAAVAAALAVLHLCFRKEFLFTAMDMETARTTGLPVTFWDFLLMTSIGLCVSFTMRLAGVLFVFASLIAPGLTGLAICRRVASVQVFSVVFAMACVVAGLAVSFRFDLPASPAIICWYVSGYVAARLGARWFRRGAGT